MWFKRLHAQHLRCLESLDIELSEGINVFVGANGAGKTSILEAAFLLSHGRSFRSNARDALTQRGAKQLGVFAELVAHDGRQYRLGLGREGGRWQARVDAQPSSLGELVSRCAVVCFEPGSHALIAGGAEERRQYLDWGVFHVEHAFWGAWRRYQRALKQRNSLLRQAAALGDELYAGWESELGASALHIDRGRRGYLDNLLPHLHRQLQQLLPELGRAQLDYRRGWSNDEDLADALARQRERDRQRGHTTLGSHRADWSLSFEHAPLREHLSRGQEKLAALACYLAQASLFAERRQEWPVICLDDLASELDRPHQAAVVQQLQAVSAQVLITGTDLPASLDGADKRLFHVEQGKGATLL